ncbi:MAG: hypothetical protein ACJAXH_000087, partial [Colwellia sp.]
QCVLSTLTLMKLTQRQQQGNFNHGENLYCPSVCYQH